MLLNTLYIYIDSNVFNNVGKSIQESKQSSIVELLASGLEPPATNSN